MALIKLNINNFKKNAGGIANRLVDKVVNKLEQKLENAVEDVFAKGLKKIGLSDSIAGELSARFGDAFSAGQADRFFGTSTAEQNRVWVFIFFVFFFARRRQKIAGFDNL